MDLRNGSLCLAEHCRHADICPLFARSQRAWGKPKRTKITREGMQLHRTTQRSSLSTPHPPNRHWHAASLTPQKSRRICSPRWQGWPANKRPHRRLETPRCRHENQPTIQAPQLGRSGSCSRTSLCVSLCSHARGCESDGRISGDSAR